MSWFTGLPIIGEFFKEVTNGVDELITSDEERLQVKAKITELSAPVLVAVVQAQASANELQARIVEAEAKSEDRFVRWRRPIVSILGLGNYLVVSWLQAFGFKVPDEDNAFYLAMALCGLDIGTRGVEKMVNKWANGNGKNGNGKNGG